MSVYVDPIFQWPTSIRCFKAGCCHMTADTLDELLVFARRLRLKREWLQEGHRPDRFHFDLTIKKRADAVALGAVELPSRDLLRLMEGRQSL